jgi:hypothetical protein
MATFTYEFEELPLVIAKGIPAALINGCAEIKFDRNGEWEIDGICVEGYQNLTSEERAAGKRPWIYVKAPFELVCLIAARLEIDWKEKVDDAINEQRAIAREEAAEFRAEMRREDRMGL